MTFAPRKSAPRLGSSFETLEDRSLPSTFGIPWADPAHLTLSFAPDGTGTPTGPSTLSRTLGAAGTTSAWEREVLRAFQSWAAVSNINFGVVADGGQALGSLGAVQGDSRFGDIRVAAATTDSDEVASASPFMWSGSTFAGDVVFNNTSPFAIGNRSAAYDVYSVAVHEAGHTLGLEHSTAAGSVMQADYAYRTGLGSADVAAIQALYGARSPDAYDAAGGNNTMARASAMPYSPAGNGELLASGDIGSTADVDYYKFNVGPVLGLTGVVVRLKAQGISLLTPSVTVYDSAGRVVGSASTTDPLNNDLTIRFTAGLFGGTYYVKVDGATNDAFGVGSYKLAADFLSLSSVLAPITTTVGAVLDGHTNDLLLTALGLNPPSSTDARFDAVYRGVIEDSTDVDDYRIRTDKYAAGTPVTLNAMVWGLDASPLDPRLRVFDSSGTPVAFQVLANDRGVFSIQVLNAVAGQNYYLQVAARNPGGANRTGSYFLAADFNQLAPTTFDGLGGGALAPGATDTGSLGVTEAGLYQFALSASLLGPGSGGVTMTVYDASGQVVFTLTAAAGQPTTTTTQYLAAGSYTVRYTTAGGTAPVGYGLFLLDLTDPVGPYSTSTASPSGSTSSSTTSGTGTSGSGYTYTGSSSTTPTCYGYTF